MTCTLDFTGLEATKAALRIQFITQRRALSAADVARQSEAIADQVLELFINDRLKVSADNPLPIIIHSFLPILRQHEVNTWSLIHRLWQEHPHLQIAVSVMNAATRQLTHYPLTPVTQLTENRWGIPEPIVTNEAPIPSGELAIILVPLLAFDQRGQRVGYGGGFYDRFLAECHPNCLKVGLSFFGPVDRITDVDPIDVRLNLVVTPMRLHWFK